MEHAKFTITVPRRERIKRDGGGFTIRELPSTQETVLVSVDLKALADLLGVKAALNKGGRAVEAKGAVVVTHVRTDRLE